MKGPSIYTVFLEQTPFQDKKIVDVWKLFFKAFKLINAKGLIELWNYHLVTPNEIMELDNYDPLKPLN